VFLSFCNFMKHYVLLKFDVICDELIKSVCLFVLIWHLCYLIEQKFNAKSYLK
jgi:hypothetical protein